MLSVISVVVIVLAVAGIAYLVLVRRRQPVPVAAAPPDDFEEGIVSEPVPLTASDDLPPAPREPGIHWAKQFESRSGPLDDEARLRLINDLGMLRAPWCVPLLVQACDEETEPAHRVAAQLALARCRDENLTTH